MEGKTMKLNIHNKLIKYMEENNLKKIMLYPSMCSTWGGSTLRVLARFADEDETFDEELFAEAKTEAVSIYLPKKGVRYSGMLRLGLSTMTGMPTITVMGAEPEA